MWTCELRAKRKKKKGVAGVTGSVCMIGDGYSQGKKARRKWRKTFYSPYDFF
jgi:hypothetical protein